MTVLTEGPRTAGYLISEANGTRSREVVTLLAGNNLPPGTVLGKVTASGKYTALAPAATDGSEKAAAVLYAGVDATAAEKPAVVTARDSEVQTTELAWPVGATAPQKTAALGQLAALGIVAR